jgi:hypothetical protein
LAAPVAAGPDGTADPPRTAPAVAKKPVNKSLLPKANQMLKAMEKMNVTSVPDTFNKAQAPRNHKRGREEHPGELQRSKKNGRGGRK